MGYRYSIGSLITLRDDCPDTLRYGMETPSENALELFDVEVSKLTTSSRAYGATWCDKTVLSKDPLRVRIEGTSSHGDLIIEKAAGVLLPYVDHSSTRFLALEEGYRAILVDYHEGLVRVRTMRYQGRWTDLYDSFDAISSLHMETLMDLIHQGNEDNFSAFIFSILQR